MTHENVTPPGTIRSEARGGHWIAWVADAQGKPHLAVVLVGLTQEEAEERVKQWKEEEGNVPV